ncbi:MAG: hypothetical protein J3R72DRAFT_436186 [Linnemannia gamsii]|nr:MAG: hypothetical protein J3R72DRAFT_436186 [Linnemannia gamsii]
MKITFTLSALVALAVTVVSAAPIDSKLSARADCRPITLVRRRLSPKIREDDSLDPYSFELTVADGKYNHIMKYHSTSGKSNDNYKETRKSDDGLWSVTHTSHNDGPVTLRVKGKDYQFKKYNTGTSDKRFFESAYYHCVEWGN